MSHKKCIISIFDCLLNISATEKKIYKPFFSSENWDPYETLNIEPFLCKFRGLRFLQNKMWFRDKQVHFLLSWSGSHSTRVVLRGPSWPLTDQISHLEVLRCPKLAQSVIRVSWGQLWHHKDNLALLRPL